MANDIRKEIEKVLVDQCKERNDYDVGSKEKIQNDANLVNLVKALNEIEKMDSEAKMESERLDFEKVRFDHDKEMDGERLSIDSRKLDVETSRINAESEIRRYESDATDKRFEMEDKTNKEKIESERKGNIFKTIVYGLGILAGVALHLGDVSAEKELGYDVEDRVSSFDKIKNDMKHFLK